jgi:cytochrome c553
MYKIITIALISVFLLNGCFYDEKPQGSDLPEHLQQAKRKALRMCAGCHGDTGIGTSPTIPNLAMQKKEYMIQQLTLYKKGKRNTHPPMSNIAKMLTDEEIQAISEWYSNTKGY